MNYQEIATGTQDGTAATIDFNIGFVPKTVKIFNTEGLAKMEWNDAMADASGVVTVTAGTMTFVVALGITPVDGVGEGADIGAGVSDGLIGFQLGADLNVNVDGEAFYWEACR